MQPNSLQVLFQTHFTAIDYPNRFYVAQLDVHLNEDKITHTATGRLMFTGKEEGSDLSTAFQVVGEFKTVEEAFAAGFAEADRKMATMKSGKR
jgi:hypothetical protein